jgi:hypothetical protein
MYRSSSLVVALVAAASAGTPVHARVPVTLKGSPASMVRQNEVARENALTFLRNPAQVQEFVAKERLVPLSGNADYETAKDVSFPYARPETRNFVEQFAPEYHAACGMKLVITSATRPLDHQPKNAHKLSVHPTGMAVDMRVPRQATCRRWLEKKLLSMETAGELDATHEIHPQHFHVAVFPEGFRKPVGPASLAPDAESASASSATAAAPKGTTARAGSGATAQAPVPPQPGGQSMTVTLAGIALSAGLLWLILRGKTRLPDEEPTDAAAEPREHDRAA